MRKLHARMHGEPLSADAEVRRALVELHRKHGELPADAEVLLVLGELPYLLIPTLPHQHCLPSTILYARNGRHQYWKIIYGC